MIRIPHQRQTSVGSELGQPAKRSVICACGDHAFWASSKRGVVVLVSATDKPVLDLGWTVSFDADGRPFVRRWIGPYLPTGRGFGSGPFHSRLRAVSPDVLRDRRPALGILPRSRPVASFLRVSATCRCRPQFLRPLDHLGCNRSDPAKSHVPCLSSAAVRYLPKVARHEKHGVPEIRASGTSDEC